jgi:endonuclease YncB( thermonuclease family)
MCSGLWRIWILVATCSWAGSAVAVPALPACVGEERPGRVSTCVSTGDRGWYRGGRWRLKDVEAPEINGRRARCRAEQIMGIRARDRLRVLMSLGYTIALTGRDDGKGWSLVTMRLFDGRDAASQLLSDGVVQALPNSENRWCPG